VNVLINTSQRYTKTTKLPVLLSICYKSVNKNVIGKNKHLNTQSWRIVFNQASTNKISLKVNTLKSTYLTKIIDQLRMFWQSVTTFYILSY